jgi:microsomal dipeptidase-like Zn-dependent dipeptidase
MHADDKKNPSPFSVVWHGGGCGLALLLLCFSSPLAAAAECQGQEALDDLWEEYDRSARSMGCASPARGPGQFLACGAVAVGKAPVKIVDKMVGYFNSKAKGGWATLGPRMLGPEWEVGTLAGTGVRTFLSPAPANTEKATVSITKTDGKAHTEVTVCATRRGEKSRKIWSFQIEKGKDNQGKDFSRVFTDVADSLISIHFDTKGAINLNTLSYKVKMETEPFRWNFGPVKGWADLHVHQAAELAQAGTMYYGSHTGPLETALKACTWQQHALPFNVGKWDQYRHGSGYPTFADWPHHLDIGHQQVHETWLKAAHARGLKLMVVSAVNNEPGCKIFSALHLRPGASCRDMPNLNAQIDAFIRFDEKNDWYEIAVDPWHARKIINENKLAVVLSLESSHLFPEDAGDFEAQFEQMFAKGVRTLQPTHEVDSRFSGAAPWSSMFEVLQTAKFPADFSQGFLKGLSSLKPGFEYETVERDGKTQKFNRVGLKKDGYRIIDLMVSRSMPVDVAHVSVKGTEEIYAHLLQKHRGFPMYQSHSRFQSLLVADDVKKQQELVTTEGQIDMIKKLGGMVGLRTGPQPIKAAPSVTDDALLSSTNECAGTVRSYRNLIAYGLKRGVTVAVGSDMNGNTSHMGSRFRGAQTQCTGGTPESAKPPKEVGAEFAEHGLRHIGLMGDMMADLRSLDTEAAAALDDSAEGYLRMWERAHKLGSAPSGSGGELIIPGNDGTPVACKTNTDCEAGKYCDTGFATAGKNQCLSVKSICSACSADKQCGTGNECKGLVGFQKCMKSNSALPMGASCCMNDQCQSNQCDDGQCTCTDSIHCESGKYCDTGFLTAGKNQCLSVKPICSACSADKQCGTGNECKGLVGFQKCIRAGALSSGASCCMNDQCQSGQCEGDVCVCSSDSHCPSGKKCKKPLLGKNRCE